MPGSFVVSTVFKGVDKTTKTIKQVTRSATKMATGVRQRFKSMAVASVRAFKTAGMKVSGVLSRMGRKTAIFGGKFKNAFGTGIAIAGIASLTLAMQAGIRTGIQFEQTVVNAAAKFGPAARPGTEAFKQLTAAAKGVGEATEFTATQAASGLNFLAMAGFSAEQSIAALPAVVDLATAAQVDLATASDIATDSLGAFGLATKDPIQLSKNLARVNDVLAKTVTTANTDMTQLFETIKEGGPIAISAGSSIEQFAALAGKLANAGIKGTRAGTTLKNVFVRLSATSPVAAKTLSKLGVATRTANGDLRDVVQILGDLDKATSKLGTAQKAEVLNNIFGRIPIAGVNVLLKEGAENMAAYQAEIQGAAGASKDMASVMRSTFGAQVKIMNSNIEALGLTIFDQLVPAFAQVVKGVTFMVGGWNQFLKLHPGIISLIVTIGKIAIPVIAVTAAVIALNVAIAALNFLIAANPVGLIVIGIVAAIAAIVVFRKQIIAVGAIIVGALISPILLLMKLLAMIPGLGGLGKAADAAVTGLVGTAVEGFGGTMPAAQDGGESRLASPQIATAKQISESRRETTNRVIIEDGTGRARGAEDGAGGVVEIIPRTAAFDDGFAGAGA